MTHASASISKITNYLQVACHCTLEASVGKTAVLLVLSSSCALIASLSLKLACSTWPLVVDGLWTSLLAVFLCCTLNSFVLRGGGLLVR
jgi:hypothetical protein